jgi:nitrogen fixation protein NifZ
MTADPPAADRDMPRFRRGQFVRAADDLVNDGSYPGMPADALLVAARDPGEVVQIGAHVESRPDVYMVAFSNGRVVGCFEHEIEPVDPAIPPVVTDERATP